MEDGVFEGIREKRVFVRGLVTADSRLETFLLVEQVLQQTELTARDGYAAAGIDGLVEGKLHSFDQMKGNGIFKATIESP